MSIQRNHPDAETIAPKTFAETQGEKPFDWNAFLERAIAGQVKRMCPDNIGRLDDDLRKEGSEHALCLLRARSWVTCACGQQCAILPRDGDGKPLDGKLLNEGLNFVCDIAAGNWKKAKQTLASIERRSAELILALTVPAEVTK